MASQRDLFLEERRGKIGCSDLGAIRNLDYGCRKQLWYRIREVQQDFPKITTPEQERGTFLEPVNLALYEIRTGRKLQHSPQVSHPDYPWLAVHMDAVTEAPEHEGKGYVEGKTVNRFTMKRYAKDGLLFSNILQIQGGLAVTGLKWGSFSVLCPDPWQFSWFDVKRDDEIIQPLLEDASIFWNQVQNGPTPDPLEDPKDKRCATCPWRKTCRGDALLAALPDSSEKEGVVPDPALLPLVCEVTDCKAISAEAKELEDAAVSALKTAIGDRYGVVVPGYRALFPTSFPERWDTKALASLYEQAQKIINTERDDWDVDSLEDKCTELLSIVVGLSKAKKAAKAERSLRIYATGD